MEKTKLTESGFTLVELVLTILISSLLMATVFTAYLSQQKIQQTQQQVVEMQQNIRVGRDMLLRELKMAGYDPGGNANATITAAFPDAISFNMDLRGNNPGDPPDDETNDPGENIAYDTYTTANGILALGRAVSSDQIDIIANGVDHWEIDTTPATVTRSEAAQHIEALEFLYELDDESTSTQPAPADYDRIVAITVTMVARSPSPDEDFSNNRVYQTAGGNNISPNDNFRRRMVIHNIKLRNMGL